MLRSLDQLSKTWRLLGAFPPRAPPQLHQGQDHAVPSHCLFRGLRRKPKNKRAIEFQIWSFFSMQRESNIEMALPKARVWITFFVWEFFKEDNFSSPYLKRRRWYSQQSHSSQAPSAANRRNASFSFDEKQVTRTLLVPVFLQELPETRCIIVTAYSQPLWFVTRNTGEKRRKDLVKDGVRRGRDSGQATEHPWPRFTTKQW